jgi:hypothetical protein
MKTPRKIVLGPSADLKLVRSLLRKWNACMRLEEGAETLSDAWKLAERSDKARRAYVAACDGRVIGPLHLNTKMRAKLAAKGAFEALATIGRVIARSVQASNALRAARAKLSRVVRPALNRVRKLLASVLAAVAAPVVAAVAAVGKSLDELQEELGACWSNHDECAPSERAYWAAEAERVEAEIAALGVS